MSKTAPLKAVRALDVRAAQALLDAKPPLLSVVDRQDRNLLHVACAMDPEDLQQRPGAQVRLVDLLLDRGMAVDPPIGRDECTALFFAVARACNVSLVERLIARARHHGLEKSYEPALPAWLVAHGASPDVAAGAGVTPRQQATRKRHPRFLAALR